MHNPQDFILAGGVFLLLFFSALFLSRIKVPYILSFMLAGLLGKSFLPHRAEDVLIIFEYSAVILLFFFIGLEYSFERLAGMKRVLKPSFLDFLFNFVPAFIITYLFTKDLVFSLVMGAVVYPSSTAITAKLLMDYKRLVNPEAELLIGILIFEDLVSIVLLSVLTGLTFGGEPDVISVSRGVLAVVFLFGVFYLLKAPSEKAFDYLDRKLDEGLVPFMVLGFLLLSSGISLKVGLSDALVAFMLGVLVPEKSRIFEVIERSLSELKDISVGVFFFMFTFHAKLNFDFDPWLLAILLAIAILLKLLSTYYGAIVYGLTKRTAMRASLSFIQRGEFSVIFASFYEPTQSLTFALVLFTALLGSFSFLLAPGFSQRLFPKREKKGPPPAPPF
ncbi:cation:proton antiporter [Pampinifervens florentissimum]|uniref:cation:proton antiporter n=1 Tax=Pampinifervens florentissimum TaxID=1632019 RepID=UPI0013B478E4|nr:cation:proton antiporter [Hydrogenobacter sp. T-8]QID33808.1 cation:proton antiporter [Hydrogenobacter sp. T-8]